MSGTGDVDCFVILRRIRKILEKEMHYGYNMAIHQSIGFLFLGSGKYTFSTNNLSIAALLMALYPRFPDSPTDNRYHLQALRHFYVLAIENRLLQTVDIVTGELVSVPLEIEYKNEENKNVMVEGTPDIVRTVNTPIMLEDMHKISRIHLKDKKYYEIIVDRPERPNYEKGTRSVFDRASHLDMGDFKQKSVSKVSVLSPFDIASQPSVGWIPKMIYVKKYLPEECENSDKALAGKACGELAPFEFSRRIAAILESKEKKDEEAEGEEEEEEEEDETTQHVITKSKLNEVSHILSSITKNPVIRKFLQTICQYKNVVYSEIEPLILKGMSTSTSLDSLDPVEYFELMTETEDLTEELDEKLQKTRLFSKNFYLGILYECFKTNKIEVLPIYLRLFNSSTAPQNPQNFLLKQGKLLSLFYKGLYENIEIEDNIDDMEDEEDMDDDNTGYKEKKVQETLVKRQFLEELEDVMGANKDDSEAQRLKQHLTDALFYTDPVDPTSVSVDGFKKLGPYLNYKNYPYVSQMLSLLILIETTQNMKLDTDFEDIRNLFMQKFGTGVDLNLMI